MDLKLEMVRVAQTDVTKLAAVSLWLSYIDTNIARLSAHMHRLLRSGPILQEVVHMGPHGLVMLCELYNNSNKHG